MPVNKSDVEKAFKRFRIAAQNAGITSTAHLELGKRGSGISHRVEFHHPDRDFPVSAIIGRTFGEAETFLSGAAFALETYRVAMKFGGVELHLPLSKGHTFVAPTDRPGIVHDPDARSLRRKAEQLPEGHPVIDA